MNRDDKDFDRTNGGPVFGNKKAPSPGGSLPPVPGHPPEGPLPPPPGHPPVQDEKLRARFELDSAYRDLRKGELVVQQIETYLPDNEEASFGRQLLNTASSIYQAAYRNFQEESYFKAAEYSVAVKDIMRGIDKFYHTAGPYPIYPGA